MLILTRKPGESLYIGDNVKVVVVEVKGSQVRLGIEADKSLRIYREEIYLQILEENKSAAAASQEVATGLEGLSEAWQGRKDLGDDDGGNKKKRSSQGLSIGSLKPSSEAAGGISKLTTSEKGLDGDKKSSPEVFTRKAKKKGPGGE